MITSIDERVTSIVPFLTLGSISKSSIDDGLHSWSKKVRLSFWSLWYGLQAIIIFLSIIDLLLNNLQQSFIEVEKSTNLILMLSIEIFLFLDFL